MEANGADTVRAAVDWTIADAHRRFSAEIAEWPDGVYEADVYVDSDPSGNRDIHVHVAITVDGDRLVVDFDGSDDRPADPGVVDVRQHARLHDRPARVARRPVDPEERRLLRLHRPARAARLVREPDSGEAGVERYAPPRCRGRRRDRHRDVADPPRPVRAADLQVRQPAPDVGRSRPPHRARVLRPRRRDQRRLGQRGARRRRLGRARRVERQPHQGVGGAQRGAVPAHPAGPQLPHRFRRRGPVARRLRVALREGGAHAHPREPVRRQPVSRASRYRRRRVGLARPVHAARRRTAGRADRRRPVGRRRAARDRRATRVRLRRRRRLGRRARARSAGRARRRVGRVRVDRRRGTRLRRRDHRLPRSLHPRPRRRRHRQPPNHDADRARERFRPTLPDAAKA